MFKNYRFEDDGYILLGIYNNWSKNQLADSLRDWYTDDISVLNDIKKEWVFENSDGGWDCGFHYIVYLCKNGEALEEIYINLNCGDIVSDHGKFKFDNKKLSKFKFKVKEPEKIEVNFEKGKLARSYIDSISNHINLIYTTQDDRNLFEGNFYFSYECPTKNGACWDNPIEYFKQLEINLKQKYIDEIFKLEILTEITPEYLIEVNCDKSLFNKFDELWKDLSEDEWKPREITNTSFWKQ